MSCQTKDKPLNNIKLDIDSLKNTQKTHPRLYSLLIEVKNFNDILDYMKWLEKQPFVERVSAYNVKNNKTFNQSKGKCFDLNINITEDIKDWTYYLNFEFINGKVEFEEWKGFGRDLNK